MEIEDRESGINLIGKIAWATHLCQFYETKQDLLDLLIPYFKTGLENNEFCLWVVSDPLGEAEAVEALRKAVPDVDRYFAAGRIEIVPHTSLLSPRQDASSTGSIENIPSAEWYLKGGAFVPEQVIKGWNEKLAKALAQGYAGMRVNANESWLTQENWKDFSQYEKTLDETLGNRRMIVLCSYPLAGMSAAQILDVANTHQFVVAKRDGNWEILESPELKRVKAKSERSNAALDHYIAERKEPVSLRPGKPPKVLKYGVAVLLVMAALIVLLSTGTNVYADVPHVSVFLCVIIVSLWFGGIGPGLLAVVLSALAFDYYFLPPIYSFAIETTELPRFLLFMVPALFIAWSSAAQRGAAESLKHSYEELKTINQVLQAEIIEHKRSKEALQMSETRLQAAIDAADIGLWDWDIVSDEITWLGHHEKLFGFAPGEFDGTYSGFEKRIHREDVAELNRAIQRARDDRSEYAHEYRVIWPSGSTRWMADRGRFLYGDAGQPVRMYGAVRDITERKEAEKALQETNSKLELILDNSPLPIIGEDGHAQVTSWNKAADRLFGWTEQEVIGNRCPTVPPEDRGEYFRMVREVMQGETYLGLVRYRQKKSGTLLSCNISVAPQRNANGKPTGMIFIIEDVGAHQQMEAALRRSENNFRTLADKSLQGIQIYQDHRVVYANPAMAAIMGYTVEDQTTMSVETLRGTVHPADRPMTDERTHKRLAGEELSPSVELRIIRKDGSTRWIQSFNNPIEYNGQPAILSTNMDITDRKQAEEALRKSERVLREAEFLGHTSSWEQDLVTGEIFNSEGNLRLFFGDVPNEGELIEDYAQAVHPDDREYVMQRRAQLLEGGPPNIEYRVIWPDGSLHVLFGLATVVRDESGRAVRVYGTNVDITERKRLEEALRQSEDSLRKVIDTIPALVWSAQPDGSLDFINQRHREFTGLALDDVRDWRWMDVIHPDDRAKVIGEWRKSLATGEAIETEGRLRRAAGDYRWLMIRAVPLRDASGRIVKWYGTKTDVTKRKQAEEALRTSQVRLQAAIDAAYIGLWDLDVVSEKMTWLGHHEELFGYAPDEFDGTYSGFEKRVHPEDVALLRRDVQRARDDRSEFSHEYRIVWPDDSIHWIAGRGRFIYSQAGQPTRMYGAVLDITERKRAQDALRRSEEHLRLVIDTIPIMAWSILPDGTFDFFNQRWMDYTGISRDPYVRDPTRPIHPDDVSRVSEKPLAAIVAAGQPYENELRVQGADGRYRWFLVRADPLHDETGKIIKWYGVSIDIDDRKRAEEGMNRQAARAETLARIAARLNKQLDLHTVVQAVCQEVVDTFKVSQATMSLYDKRRGQLVYAGGVNIPPEYAAKIEPVSRAQFDEFVRTVGPILVVPDIQALSNVPNAEFSARFNVRTVVTADLRRDHELIGVLVLGVNGHVREFDKDELNLLKAISDQAAQAIANAQLLTAANEQHEQLRALSAKLVDAQETERRAIARELHDEIGQVLNAVSTDLQAVQHSRKPTTRAARLEEGIALVDDALSRVRDLSLDLRPSMLDDLGLVAALEWYIERQAERSGFEAAFVAESPEMRLSPGLETTVFRVAQIALTNVARHAKAKHVWAELRQHPSELELVVRDDGVGFDVPAALEHAAHGASMGLLSMQERARLARGQLEIKSTPEHGTEIRARFPLN